MLRIPVFCKPHNAGRATLCGILIFLYATLNETFAQTPEFIISTEISARTLNDLNVSISKKVKEKQYAEATIGINFNSRILSGKCGFLGILQEEWIQELTNTLGIYLKSSYAWRISDKFTFGPQISLGYGRANNVVIIERCWGGGGTSYEWMRYDLASIFDASLEIEILFGPTEHWIQLFLAPGIKYRYHHKKFNYPYAHLTRYDEVKEWVRRPLLNVGARINLHRFNQLVKEDDSVISNYGIMTNE